MDAQKHYCVAEVNLAIEMRNRIKGIVLRPYADFASKFLFISLIDL